MSDVQFVAALSISVSWAFLLVIWWFIWGHRDDNLRDQLFTLRDEMFLYAFDQGIDDTAAYENLRLLLNGLIRYAHRVSLGRLLLLDLSRRVFKLQPSAPPAYAEWVQAVAALPADEAQHMRDFHDKAMLLIMKHMIAGSPLLWCAVGVVVFHVVVFKSTRVFIDSIVRSVRRRVPSLDLFEADALRTM
jgi:hypothetical protein